MKRILIAAITLVFIGCTHEKDGWIVKAQDGNLYRLEQDPCSEGYRLRVIDSAALSKFINKLNDINK